MLSIIRKSTWFKDTLSLKYKKVFEKTNEETTKTILDCKKTEECVEEIVNEYEKEIKALEMKYDKKIQEKLKERKERAKTMKHFWLNALSNHRLFKDFISHDDIDVLRYLEDVSYNKIEDGNSFKLSFTFAKNEYFTNDVIDKTYTVNDEHLILEIKSTEINWTKRSIVFEKVEKQMKNKKTGEVAKREIEVPKKSFFNFFSNVKIPTKEEVKDFDFDQEKELGPYLDMEFEYGMEFVEEFIPHATDYYLGLKTESDEYGNYLDSQAKKHKYSM